MIFLKFTKSNKRDFDSEPIVLIMPISANLLNFVDYSHTPQHRILNHYHWFLLCLWIYYLREFSDHIGKDLTLLTAVLLMIIANFQLSILKNHYLLFILDQPNLYQNTYFWLPHLHKMSIKFLKKTKSLKYFWQIYTELVIPLLCRWRKGLWAAIAQLISRLY